MATVNYSLRIDEADKQKAERIFNDLGLTLAAGFNIYIKTVIRNQCVPFNLTLNNKDIILPSAKKVSRIEKEKSYKAVSGILAGYEIDLEKEREERILSK